MTILEIMLIVACSLFVSGVIVAAIIRRRRGKSGCNCCSSCASCPHCTQKAAQESKGQDGI